MSDKLLLAVIGLLSVAIIALQLRARQAASSRRSVAIIVLGDIGRSPRMLYHALSFAALGYKTHIVAYAGSTPPKELLEAPKVEFVYLPTPLAWVSKMPKAVFLLFAPLKVVAAAFNLLWALVWRIQETPGFLFVQNPPSIPTLPIVQIAAKWTGSKIMIDWHNTGYSVLALRLGDASPVVRLAKGIETFWGRKAYAHLCVTRAMKEALIRDAQLQGNVVIFHDRPPVHFKRQTFSEKQELFSRLPLFSSPSLLSFSPPSTTSPASTSPPTIFTPSATGSRPALLVSATSWTADEDFSILLSALSKYEKSASSPGADLPKIVMMITGKGAGKQAFEAEVEQLEKSWEWVRVRTSWLEIEDYPKLLGSADLGISLHTSTSGADLPMKVVDMFGCGLPVLALDFACVDELVQDNINGRTFRSAAELADQLTTLLKGSPGSTVELDRLQRGILQTSYGEEGTWSTWDENWTKVVRPLLQ